MRGTHRHGAANALAGTITRFCSPALRRSARLIAPALLLLIAIISIGGMASQADAGKATPPTVIPAARQASNIAVITIEGEITQTTFTSIKRRINLAERAGADALIFDIHTPGGDLYAVLGICNEIKSSSITNTVAWINTNAYSGGAVIALACREIVTNDPATMGDALPIALNSFGMINQLPEHERQKFLSPLIAELVDSARRNGYDELLVQGIAARGVELWLVEHKDTQQELFITRGEYRLLFGEEPPPMTPVLPAAPPGTSAEGPPPGEVQPLREIPDRPRRRGQRGNRAPPDDPSDPNRYIPAAPSMGAMSGDVTLRQELPSRRPTLTRADRGEWTLVEYVSTGDGPMVFKADDLVRYGLAVETVRNDEELKAFFGAKNMIRLDPTWSEGLVAFLTWRPIQGLLVVVFLLALFIEMTSPGMGLPGSIAAVALVALLAPPLLINMASWWVIAAIVVGIAMIALEIFVLPGMGVFGLLGLLLLFGGLLGLFIPDSAFFPDTPGRQSDLLYGATTLLLALTTSGILMYFVARHFGSLPIFNRLMLKEPGALADDDDADDLAGDELLAAADVSTAIPVRVGMTGTALTTLRPVGRVELDDRIVDVSAVDGYIPAGTKVRICRVSDFRIDVEPLSEQDGPPRFGEDVS